MRNKWIIWINFSFETCINIYFWPPGGRTSCKQITDIWWCYELDVAYALTNSFLFTHPATISFIRSWFVSTWWMKVRYLQFFLLQFWSPPTPERISASLAAKRSTVFTSCSLIMYICCLAAHCWLSVILMKFSFSFSYSAFYFIVVSSCVIIPLSHLFFVSFPALYLCSPTSHC